MSAVSLDREIFTQNQRLRKDHRRHRRIDLVMHGRYLNEANEEHSLVTVNISCGGVQVRSNHSPNIDDQVVCYFDDLGRVVGSVVRHTEDGFAINFKAAQVKRDRLADKLLWLYNKDKLGLVEERGAQRFAAEGPAIVIRQDGRRLQCRVIDISLTGAGFETDGPPPVLGEIVITGNISGEVVRRTKNRFGVRFIGQPGRPS